MKDADILQEQYEDRLFSLLMKRHAQIEGNALLRQKQELNEDERAAVPEEIVESGRKVIRKALAEKNRKSAGMHLGKFFLRFAIAAVITVSLIGAALGASASLRRSAMNLLMKMDPQMASWLVDREDTSGTISITATWKPIGYHQVQSQADEMWAKLVYENDSGGSIYVFAGRMNNAILEADTHNTDKQSLISINGYSVIITEKVDSINLSWFDDTNSLSICINATNINLTDLITFSEHLTFSS